MTIKLTAKDLSAIRLPAIALIVAIVFAAVMVQYSLDKRRQAQRQNREQSIALEEARNRFQRSGEERESILRYLPAYRQLQKEGFIGGEQRLNWVDSLRAANARAGLFGILYQINAQERYAQLRSDNPVAQRVRHSKMMVSFGVVHEADLMRFFRAVEAQQTGIFSLNHCGLDRGARQDAPQARRDNLTAQCELSWLTLNLEGSNR